MVRERGREKPRRWGAFESAWRCRSPQYAAQRAGSRTRIVSLCSCLPCSLLSPRSPSLSLSRCFVRTQRGQNTQVQTSRGSLFSRLRVVVVPLSSFFFPPSPIFSPLNHARQKNPTRNSRSSYTRIPFAVYNNERAPCRFEFNREPVIDAYACVHELAVRRDTVTRCVKFPEKESVARSERRRKKERETARLLDGFLNQTIDTELDWKLRNNRCG